MNSLIIISFAIVAFFLGYRFYARKIASIWQLDSNRATPAVVRNDGVDYVPAKNWFVLFGHHFASIAGAGPIIGPIIAVSLWGWGPALLWIIIGSIFIGGIHDFGSLITSVREDGSTIGDISEKSISKKAKIILSIFIWLALVLVVAVFAYFGANTFVKQPEVVLPSLGILPIALLVGLVLYKFNGNVVLITIFGLACLCVLIYLGKSNPIIISSHPQTTWIVILLIYCFFASIIPVNVLLQPRDYLSSFLLFAWIILSIIGIVVSHPKMNTPIFIANKSSLGYLWPMMFITVACGANSGFHSIVSSGTTSKQLANEHYAKRIGFGGMLVEGLMATIVVILVVGGLSLSEFNQHLTDETSPVHLFGIGFGNITSPILGGWGNFIALTILNIFILTTLDSATRITRYVSEELFRIKNRYLSTFVVVALSGLLALGKDSAQNPLWKKIWPVFGASNQLVAALALLVISCWLLSKKRQVLFSLIPAVFMIITSLAALGFQIINYWKNKEVTLIVISIILISTALYLIKEVFHIFKKSLKKDTLGNR